MMARQFSTRACFLVWGMSLSHAIVSADDAATESKPKETIREDRLCERYAAQASQYEMTLSGSVKPLTLESKPIFRWLNPARVGRSQVHHGLLFAWTRNGRAEAIGTVFSVTTDSTEASYFHELHSLSTGGIHATRQGQVQWDSQEPGIELKPFPDAPPPAENDRQRANQMKQLARKFTGYSINYDDKRWELSLLPQPIYRMPESQPEALDQAVFAMVTTAGTDPEVLLVIEARPVDGKMQWQYAVCRFSDLKTWVSLDEQEVWSFANGTKGASTDADASRRYRFIFADSEDVK